MEVSQLVVPVTVITAFQVLAMPPAHAFNSFTHELITRNAINYLRTHEQAYSETGEWLGEQESNQLLMEESLVRSVVDADYHTNLWINGFFHHPFTGASHTEGFTLFTGMSHFLNVTVKGDYWQNDGYAYRHSDHTSPDDNFLDTPSAKVEGKLSAMLGGHSDQFPEHGLPLGPYNLGFKGSARDWQKLYDGHSLAKAVFPPANVPAQLAFTTMLSSARAEQDKTETWNEDFPLITGIFSTGHLNRHYWRGEIKHLPLGFDLLGLSLHLVQDVHVPQHAAGTADWCHQELEDLVDRLACATTHNIDLTPFRNGTFDEQTHALSCGFLYDEGLVRQFLGSTPALDPRSDLPVGERLRAIATQSARWQWGEPSDSVDFLGTVLPDGTEFTGNKCGELLDHAEINKQAKIQYNRAVAASVVLFEIAAHDYESLHRPRGEERTMVDARSLLNVFQLFQN